MKQCAQIPDNISDTPLIEYCFMKKFINCGITMGPKPAMVSVRATALCLFSLKYVFTARLYDEFDSPTPKAEKDLCENNLVKNVYDVL